MNDWKSYKYYDIIFQVDGELRTYGSATELTGSTATVIMIKHGDLLCANLGNCISQLILEKTKKTNQVLMRINCLCFRRF